VSDERKQEQGASVFGNLPASRPGTRSPRRAPEGTADTSPADESHPDPPAGRKPPAKADPPPPRAAVPEPADEADEAPGGLEDLAWAGVAAAAEAATLGVRLATRAVEALRDAAPRR